MICTVLSYSSHHVGRKWKSGWSLRLLNYFDEGQNKSPYSDTGGGSSNFGGSFGFAEPWPRCWDSGSCVK